MCFHKGMTMGWSTVKQWLDWYPDGVYIFALSSWEGQKNGLKMNKAKTSYMRTKNAGKTWRKYEPTEEEKRSFKWMRVVPEEDWVDQPVAA